MRNDVKQESCTVVISRKAVLDLVQYYTDFESELYKEIQKLPAVQLSCKGHQNTDRLWFRSKYYICLECCNTLDFDGVNVGKGGTDAAGD